MSIADIPAAITAVAEALRAAAGNPADAIRCLSNLADFYPAVPAPNSPISINQARTTIAMAALCRQAALVSLARACASYQPTSYDDAIADHGNSHGDQDRDREAIWERRDVRLRLGVERDRLTRAV